MTTMPDLPDFLRVENRVPLTEEQQKALQGWLRRPPRRSRKSDPQLPRTMDATSWALLRAQEKAKAEARAERLRQLKERRAEQREYRAQVAAANGRTK